MCYRFAHIMRTVDIIFVVHAKLQVVFCGCRPDEVGIGPQGVVVVDTCPSLLALLSGIGKIVVGVECVFEGVVPQPALERQGRCQACLGMEIDLVFVPFRIDAELRLAVPAKIGWNMLFCAHKGIAHYILVSGIWHVSHLGVEVDVTRP